MGKYLHITELRLFEEFEQLLMTNAQAKLVYTVMVIEAHPT
jgi:hypothetical protein